MQTLTVAAGAIEQSGIASIIKTFLYTVAGAFLSILLATIYHYNFGGYEALAMILLPTLFKAVEKFFFSYNIAVVDPSVGQSAESSSAPTVPQ